MSAPVARTACGFIALTVAAVPTGMNAGVRMSPRCMRIVPVRALPSRAWISKAKRVIARAAYRIRAETAKKKKESSTQPSPAPTQHTISLGGGRERAKPKKQNPIPDQRSNRS